MAKIIKSEQQARWAFVDAVRSFTGARTGNAEHQRLVDTYNSNPHLPRGYRLSYTDAWCAATVSAASVQLGWTDIIPAECSCGRMIDLLMGLDCWVEQDNFVPQAGDLIFYDWEDTGSGDNRGYPNHVGTVEYVGPDGIHVLEGNKGGSFGPRIVPRDGRYIRGFGCPKYAKKVGAPSTFTDVDPGAWYARAVQWALDKGITSGIADHRFGPDEVCSRAQAVTFLWRLVGSPEPAGVYHPFSDVNPASWYAKAVQWAMEKGVTSGADEKHFCPEKTCTRAQVVTFLWRAAGSPAAEGDEFDDVAAGDYFRDAVHWAFSRGITAGIYARHYGPNEPCTRAMVVTMLQAAEKYI